MLPFHLVVLGPQGSGKGTQNELLSQKFQMPVLIPGDLLRSKAKENSPLGKKIQKILAKGGLAPHLVTKKLMSEALARTAPEQTVIFDSWPRALPQIKHFEDILKKQRKVQDFKVLVIQISKPEAIKRLAARRVCEKCFRNFKPPESLTLKRCPYCGGRLIQRSDDFPQAIEKRLKIYEEETKPVINYFQKKKKKILYINGEQSIPKVFQEIEQKLKKESD